MLNALLKSYSSEQDIPQDQEWHSRYSEEERLLLKDILIHFGYDVDVELPQWTPENNETVKIFQQDNFIRVDGKIGPETLSSMSLILQELHKHNRDESLPDNAETAFGKILFRHKDNIKVGDIIKYWHYDYDKWLFARVTKIKGTEVSLLDWRRKENFVLDMDNIKGY